MIGYHYEKYEITLEVPEGVSLNVRGDDGDYRIRNVDGSIALDLDDADVELSACSGDDFRFRLDDGDIVMDEGKGKLDVDADDADVHITNANFTSIIADVDDGDLQIETSLADNGDYVINAQDGLVALTVTKGGGKFDVRHGDSRVTTEGNFTQIDRSDNRTSLVLASGNARVDIRADDGRVRLVKR
jgi:ferric-dicitrate binding protein FerR (iron transport regulator)